MSTVDNPTARTLADLGVTQPAQVAPLFAKVRASFEADSAGVQDELSWKNFRDAWLGRKSGVLTLITDNWLKPATPELKRAVGASLNELRAHVEAQIETRRLAIEAGADTAALARERVDLSLPGVIRPTWKQKLKTCPPPRLDRKSVV